jgi:hypothetical protein
LDVQEVRKLDGYLKKLFGNTQIRVVPKGSDTAEIFVAEDDLGELTVDDEDGERSHWKSISARSSSPCCFWKSKKAAGPIFSNCRSSTSIWWISRSNDQDFVMPGRVPGIYVLP